MRWRSAILARRFTVLRRRISAPSWSVPEPADGPPRRRHQTVDDPDALLGLSRRLAYLLAQDEQEALRPTALSPMRVLRAPIVP